MVTIKLESQFTSTATLVALPRESEANSSAVISQGILPGPIEKEITYAIAVITVRYFNH